MRRNQDSIMRIRDWFIVGCGSGFTTAGALLFIVGMHIADAVILMVMGVATVAGGFTGIISRAIERGNRR